MKIQINGENREINNGCTIEDILKIENIPTKMIAVERNLEIVPKSKYRETFIQENDKIEIVNFVGGG